MFFMYIIKSEEGRFYIGSSDDVEKRLTQHNTKQFKGWTSRYNNWLIVHTETFSTRTDALIREKQIKKMKGGVQFKELISGSLGS